METTAATHLLIDVMTILVAGLAAGIVCKLLRISMLVGYLLAGALIGEGGLALVSGHNRELEYVAQAGALLLLFSIGIEFSLEQLVRLSRYITLGGSVQVGLVALPVMLICLAAQMPLQSAVVIAFATSLSSTVLVFKALAEWGQTTSRHGRSAIGILLFQDMALVPLLLFLPLLAGSGEAVGAESYVVLVCTSLLFVASVPAFRTLIARWIVPLLARLRSAELLILFALAVLGAAGLVAFRLGLPPAVGALAAGLVLSGNRLSQQVDALVLPYRETFAAVFFVSLGTLLKIDVLLAEPLMLTAAIAGVLLLKTAAAGAALWVIGLPWRGALGMGLGMAQLGEFSFVLLSSGVSAGAISQLQYSHVMLVALVSLILTPQLLSVGLRWATAASEADTGEADRLPDLTGQMKKAIVVGLGPIGRHVGSRLEIMGIEVGLVDMSPVNVQPFAQQGFHCVAGDAREPDVLRRVGANDFSLAVVTVPDDVIAGQVVAALREISPRGSILARCRYLANAADLKKAGANVVVSEESHTSEALLRLCDQIMGR